MQLNILQISTKVKKMKIRLIQNIKQLIISLPLVPEQGENGQQPNTNRHLIASS